MKRVWAKMGKEEKGFTLIELLAVLVIIAIIAVIAIPLIGNIINNSRDNADMATASQIYNAARLYVVGENNGNFGTVKGAGASDPVGRVTLAMLQGRNYIDSNLVLPSSKVALNGATTYASFNTSGSLTGVTLNGTTISAEEVLKATKNSTP
ncbi:prepilin-type N-terminal cleavage/methylation domain-containing protein [Saccharibacillus kuerlensis]|nr:prepilin-type N-terminal cleavage/methylation domain-containing protein [Saccharibacillus kuerlensis]